jgi:hypothetical protein
MNRLIRTTVILGSSLAFLFIVRETCESEAFIALALAIIAMALISELL